MSNSFNIIDHGAYYKVTLNNSDTMRVDKSFISSGGFKQLSDRLEVLTENSRKRNVEARKGSRGAWFS